MSRGLIRRKCSLAQLRRLRINGFGGLGQLGHDGGQRFALLRRQRIEQRRLKRPGLLQHLVKVAVALLTQAQQMAACMQRVGPAQHLEGHGDDGCQVHHEPSAGQGGGGAFVLFYLIFLIILGLPIMTMEFAVGRASRKSPVRAYQALEKPGQKWHIHGYFTLIGCYLLMMFYTTVAGWMLHYFYMTAAGKLSGLNADEVAGKFTEMLASPGIMTFWMVFVVVLGILVCAKGLQNGLERVTKGMMIALLLIMVILAVNSLFMDGAKEGLSFFLVALEAILEGKVALSGLLAVMAMAAVLKMKGPNQDSQHLASSFGNIWIGAEVVLFVLVGAAVDIRYLGEAGLPAILLIVLALLVRSLGVYISVSGSQLNAREKVFAIIAYLPKATVQAAIGSVPLAAGLESGKLILSVAVIGIALTAPLGALLMDASYQKLLTKD